MKKTMLIILILISLILLVSCQTKDDLSSNKDTVDKESETENKSEEEMLEEKLLKEIENLSLEEKIGQLLVLGFEGKAMNEDLEKLIKIYKPGGLIFFKRNISDYETTKKLVNDIKIMNKENPYPLFLSIDEEGGLVTRLDDIFGDLPPMKELGRLDDTSLTRDYGKLLALRLKALGLNLNYAPVLDINTDKNNPVIGNRAFGDDKDLVREHGLEILKGLNSEDIYGCVKHFPGHGDTSVDSHLDMPIIKKDMEEISNLELVPFKSAIENDVDMIMVGHILFEAIDQDKPASLSNKVINELLREDLSYKGVITSDDLTMGGILNHYSISEAVVEFLKAGGDMPLICHEEDLEEIYNEIENAIEEGELSIEKIDEKLLRILKLKDKYQIDIKEEVDLKEMEELRIRIKNKLSR